jgi:signal peptidase I
LVYEGGGDQKLEEKYLSDSANGKNSEVSELEASVWKKSSAKRIFTVPVDKYFVLGDNRAHSLDSRYFAESYVPKERIKGRYLFTIYK